MSKSKPATSSVRKPSNLQKLPHQTRTDDVFRVLFEHHAGLWCADIAEILKEDPCHVTSTLKRMEQAGTVARKLAFRPKTGRSVWFYTLVTMFDSAVWPDWSMVRVMFVTRNEQGQGIAHLDRRRHKPDDDTQHLGQERRSRPCHPARSNAFA